MKIVVQAVLDILKHLGIWMYKVNNPIVENQSIFEFSSTVFA